MNDLLISNAKAFYLNEGSITISDMEYDALLKSEKDLDPNFNILDAIGLHQGSSHSLPFQNIPELPRRVWVSRDELIRFITTSKLTPLLKYDGSSVIAFYKNGKLRGICSGNTGSSQLRKLKNFFPETVNPEITEIYCEATIPLIHGFAEGSRQKANGMIISKYRQAEVDSFVKIMAYGVKIREAIRHLYWDFLHSLTESDKFEVAKPANLLSDDWVDNYYNGHLIDGFVLYDELGRGYIHKFQSLTEQTTEVIGVRLRHTDKNTISTVLQITPLKMEGITIRNITTNGCRILYQRGLGVGAEIKVMRLNSVIPAVKEVVTPSDVHYYECPACKSELTESNILGSVFKCPNPECPDRVSLFNWKVDTFLGTDELSILTSINESVDKFLGALTLSRFSHKNSSLGSEYLINLIIHADYEEFKSSIKSKLRLSGIMSAELDIHLPHIYKRIQENLLK